MDAPPSPTWWALDGELYGHTPAETIGYLAHCADYADEQAAVRSRSAREPSFVISPRVEPRAVTRLRRLFGR
jgi:hypothetical protein